MDNPRENKRAKKPRPSLIKRLGRIFIVFGLAGVTVRVGGCAERLAYFPSRQPFITPPGTEDVEFESADGTKLHGWFMPATNAVPDAPGPAILHVHGNARNIASHDSFSRFFTQHGFGVLIFDYRRYGRSENAGPLRRRALLADTQAALAVLTSRPDVDSSRIGVYGVSLGGVFALHAAADDPGIQAVVTVSAFSTWRGVAHDMAPVLGPLLFPGGLEPADAAARLGDRPYLIMHGLDDGIINPRHADLLAAAARSGGVEVDLWIDQQGDHNTMIQTNPLARKRLVEFFTAALATPAKTDEPATDSD
jgi:dipeptidyl aminopeptidase/acylaminoacyl peptidase